MSTRANHVAIGAFVLGALIIAAIGIAVIFGEGWGRQRVRVVMVFDGNVAGLDVGTPVEFRGVRIGEVKRIRSIYDTAVRKPRFAVYGLLTGDIEVDGMKSTSPVEQREWLKVMIDQGLRARLETKSFVTGQQRVMLDFFPDTRAEFSSLETGLPEIPTLRSPGEELVAELREIPFREIVLDGRKLLKSLKILLETDTGEPGPLPTMLVDISRVARGIEDRLPTVTRELARTATDTRETLAEARTAISGVRETLDEARKLIADTQVAVADARRSIAVAEDALRSVNRGVDSGSMAFEGAAGAVRDAGNQVRALASRVEDSIARLDRTLARIEHTVSEDSPVAATLSETMREIGSAAHSLRSAAELLTRRPEVLLRGRGETPTP